jgi:hypothetical protein
MVDQHTISCVTITSMKKEEYIWASDLAAMDVVATVLLLSLLLFCYFAVFLMIVPLIANLCKLIFRFILLQPRHMTWLLLLSCKVNIITNHRISYNS